MYQKASVMSKRWYYVKKGHRSWLEGLPLNKSGSLNIKINTGNYKLQPVE